MKIFRLILLIGMVLLGACQDSVQVDGNWIADQQGYYLELDKTDLVFDNPRGGTAVFNVLSEGTPWVITEVPDWISLSADRGTSSTPVTVSVAEYKQSGNRTGSLKFSSDTEKWSFSKYVIVTQVGAGPYLEIDKLYFVFDGKANKEIVPVSSNFQWYVSAPDWISVEQNEDSMVLSVEINDTGSRRDSYVFIMAAGNEPVAMLTVIQEPAKASVTQDPHYFGLQGGSFTATVTSEAPWVVANSSSWWTVTPSSGEPGETEVSVFVGLNDIAGDRSDKIEFRLAHAKPAFGTIEIVQEGAYLELNDESVLHRLSSIGGEAHVTLNANIPWEIIEAPDFLSITPMSGNGTTELTLTFPSNQSFDEKYGDLFIKWVDHDSQWSYWVSQRSRIPQFGPEVSLGSSYLSDKPVVLLTCDSSAQTLTLVMDLEGPWKLVYDRTFFDVTPTASSGKCTLTFTVDEDESGQGRTGYVNIRPRGVPSYDDSQPSPWYIVVTQVRKNNVF